VRFAFWVLVATLAGFSLGACGSGASGGATPTPVPVGPATLQTVDLLVGTGAQAVVGSTLTVNYTGWLYDPSAAETKGQQFDTSVGRTPIQFRLGASQVIGGWDQGLVGMKVGGQRRLTIPPSLAYGASGRGPIPPNATLVFDVELLGVQG
jgi:FKBP-type peptidyl-prolyl cis-trans isomerase FkpA